MKKENLNRNTGLYFSSHGKETYAPLKRLVQSSLFLLVLICPFLGSAQNVTIDTTGYSAMDLTNLLLNNGCANITDASFSSSQSVAHFDNNGGAFPMQEGVLIRSGKAAYSAGPYSGSNLSTQINNESDPDLVDISSATGQPYITDVAYLEFEFIPLSDHLSFDFLFASNEYGEWQCFSSDAFAFMLTNLNTGASTNIGVIPGTSIPVSVANIHDSTYNADCASSHPDLFDVYNVNDPGNSTINMRGYTQVMTASAPLTPGVPYRIRLVIGDANDADYDSAIFLGAGSFHTSFNLGPDKTICSGDTISINTGLDPADYSFVWKKDGVLLPNEQGASLTVSQTGTYKVEVSRLGYNCTVSDEIDVVDLTVNPPADIQVCDVSADTTAYNLTQNNAAALGLDPSVYKVVYYASQQDVDNDNPIPNNEVSAYQSTGNETIYIKIYDTESGLFCDSQYSFQLTNNPEITVYPPDTIGFCYNADGYFVNFTQVENQVVNGASGNYDFYYFHTQQEAENVTDTILNPDSYFLPAGFSVATFWVRVEKPGNSDCFAVIDFQVVEHPQTDVDHLNDTVVCEQLVLPPLQNGHYYTQDQGGGQQLHAGDTITDIGTYYIYLENAFGCNNQSSFFAFVVKKYDVTGTYCDHFEIPTPKVGHFYSAPDGPYGYGQLIPSGTLITTDTTVYYYAEVEDENGNRFLCRDDPMEITIHPLPRIDSLPDVVTCESYTLPPINYGDYYSQSGGQGTSYAAGEEIDSSMEMYIYAEDSVCHDQTQFTITIIPDFQDVISCGPYTLPPLETGNYYTDPMGQGTQIPEGTEITSSQTVYVFAQTTQTPNCTNFLSFHVTIHPVPPVDSLHSLDLCEDDFYVLPPLDHGHYYTHSGGSGTQLHAGDTIDDTQTIYVFNENPYCSNETSFTVKFYQNPPVSHFVDVYSCGPYVIDLPDPAHGKIYTEPHGQGEMLTTGDVVSTTQKLYIYNQLNHPPYCESQTSFTVHVIPAVDVGEYDDVVACDSFMLNSLPEGNYYTKPGGRGQELHPGDIIDSSMTLYVYAEEGDRFICRDQQQFHITISKTPELPAFADVTVCGSYTLPPLDTADYSAAYYRMPFGAAQSKIKPEDYTFNQPGVYTIYVYARAFDNPDCYAQKKFTVEVRPTPTLHIPDGVICIDPVTGETLTTVYLQSGVDTTNYQVQWYYDGDLVHTGAGYEAEKSGDYLVKAVSLNPNDPDHCDYEPTEVNVTASSAPLAEAYTTQDFQNTASIYVNILSGAGSYKYSLDDGPFQSQPAFHDVSSGPHEITVKDIHGICGVAVLHVLVLKYPKFFTPNNDGVNDTWNIKDLVGHPEARIDIFDRYGKLLQQIKPSGPGWDGTFNGKPMPTNDYWFKVTYTINGQDYMFRSHFTLKR